MAAGQGIGEFYVSLAVDAASGQLNVSNLISSFGQLEIATIAEIGALYSLAVGIAGIVDDALKGSLAFEQFSMHTGLSAQELQKWQLVAQQSHASAEDVTGSVENLTKHLANLAIGIPDAALGSLQQLGINALDASGKAKSAFTILDEVRHRLGGVSDVGQQERILSGLGINANLRETLLLTDAIFNKRGSIVPGMSKEEEERLDHLRTAFVEIGIKAKQLGIDLASGVAPAMESVARWTAKVLEDLIKIAAYLLKLEPVQQLIKIGGASLNTVGDLLHAAAGGGLDVNDIVKQRNAMAGAYNNLRADFLPGLPAAPTGGGGKGNTSVAVHNTYHVHDASDPHKIVSIIDRHWDEILGRRTLDGFDQQNNLGGY